MANPTIIYIGGFLLPDKNAAAQRVINNSKLLRDLGYKVILIGTDKQSGKGKDILSTKNKYLDFEYYSMPYPRNSMEWFKYILSFKTYRKIIATNGSITAVFCYNLPAGSLLLLFWYSKLRKFKIFADCTEWYEPPKNAGFLFKYAKKFDVYLRMVVIHPKLDGIISISQFLFDYYKKKRVKTILVPPLVDTANIVSMGEQIVESKFFKLIYAGTPFSLKSNETPKDRLDIIITALERLLKEGFSFQFHIVGITRDEFLIIYPQFNHTLKICNNSMVFHGIVSHQKAIELLSESDYSIFLRDVSIVTKAGFPTKFVESVSYGVPVLTNKSSNISDFLIEGENGFWVDISNQESIYMSLRKAINIDKKKLLHMKNYCLQSKIFDYRNYFENFKSLLN